MAILTGTLGNDTLTGGAENDSISGLAGNDTIDGGAGNDTAVYDGLSTDFEVTPLSNGSWTVRDTRSASKEGTDTLFRIEQLQFNNTTTLLLNTYVGDAGVNTLTGGAGSDVLNGAGGVDVLDGTGGSDLYLMANGDHTAAEVKDSGTSGIDEIRFTATDVSTLTLFAGDTGIERVVIGTGSASLADSSGTAAIDIDASLVASPLTIVGNAGANVLIGTGYADAISGGAGNDTLNGGLGTDRAVFSGKYANYTVTTSGNSTIVIDNVGTDGTDTLLNMEELAFSDKTVPISGGLRGIAYDWKNHMLLKDVSVGVTGGAAPVDAPIQFKGLTVDASGHGTFEVWSHSTKAFENAGFEIDIPKATGITFTAGALPANAAGASGWTVTVNADVSKLSMAGFATDTSYAVSAADFKLGTLTFEIGTAQSVDAYLVGGDVGDATASAYGLSGARTSTNASGEFSFSALQSGTYNLSATRATTDIGSAVTSADALAALKLAVGINPNADPDGTGPESAPVVSPYQFMAADVTGTDGKVTSADALAILKMAVKLPTAPTKEWMFVEESRDFWSETISTFTLNRTAAAWGPQHQRRQSAGRSQPGGRAQGRCQWQLDRSHGQPGPRHPRPHALYSFELCLWYAGGPVWHCLRRQRTVVAKYCVRSAPG